MLFHWLIGFLAITATAAMYFPKTKAHSDAVESHALRPKSDFGKTLFLVVEATTQNSEALQLLTTNFTDVLGIINPYWFSQYVVIGFDSYGVNYHNATTTAPGLKDLLQSVVNSATTNNGCDLPLLEAVMNGLSYYTFDPHSVVYLITTAGAFDQQLESVFFRAAVGWQIELQYVLLSSSTCDIDMYSPNTHFVANLAITTDGNFMQLREVRNLNELVYCHLPTLYNTLSIENPTQGSFRCLGTSYYVAVEANVQTVILYNFRDEGLLPSVLGPHSTDLNLYINYSGYYYMIVSFTPVDGPGIYKITLTNYGICNLQVRFQGNTSTPSPTSTTTIIPARSTTSFPIPTSVTDNTPSTTATQPLPSAETVSTESSTVSVTPATTEIGSTELPITTPQASTIAETVSTESTSEISTSPILGTASTESLDSTQTLPTLETGSTDSTSENQPLTTTEAVPSESTPIIGTSTNSETDATVSFSTAQTTAIPMPTDGAPIY